MASEPVEVRRGADFCTRFRGTRQPPCRM